MIRVALTFEAGRYHATPWGRHVNEGAVEWPPSPWRVLRALLASGFTRLGWLEVPSDGKHLFESLAEVEPIFYIPDEVTSGHTRHYMPDGGVAENKKDPTIFNRSTDLVIDAFVALSRNDVGMVVEWPVSLSAPELELLDQLVSRLSYLGRAESWVSGRLVDRVPAGLVPCEASPEPPSVGAERLDLHAPLRPSELAARVASLAAVQPEAGKRKKTPSGGAAPPVPANVLEALTLTTMELQSAGWSDIPGCRRVTYWRPANAIRDLPSFRVSPPGLGGRAPTTALLSLTSDTVNTNVTPQLVDAVWQGENIHAALVSVATRRGARMATSCLTGIDENGQPARGHRHAHILPCTLDRRAGRIDHVLVHAPGGLDDDALQALLALRRTFGKDLPTLFTTVVGIGNVSDFTERVPILRASNRWCTVTPFVAPRHLKIRGANSLLGQVSAECESRGIPRPVNVRVGVQAGPSEQRWIDTETFDVLARANGLVRGSVGEGTQLLPAGLRLSSRFRHFRRCRRDPEKAPPSTVGLELELEFEVAVQGPLALGYGSHFGLGLFTPV